MKNLNKTVAIILLALICTSTLLAIANAQPLNVDASKEYMLDDRSDYLPVVAPTPHTSEGPADFTTIGYDLATGTTTEVPYEHACMNELGIESTDPYEGLLASEEPATIFPPDGRTVVPYSTTKTYPWRTVCKLYMEAADGSHWMCSGAIIGPGQGNHGYWILTCAHCVYMHDNGGWVSSVEVIPGYDGDQTHLYQKMPYYHAWVVQSWTYTKWVTDEDWNYDIAWCRLDRNVGDYTGWMGRLTASPSWSGYTGILNTAGYPGDLSGGRRMYYDADYGTYANEYKIWFLMDVMGGQSGSPVWYKTGDSRYIIGTVCYHGSLPYGNSGTRLNQATFDWLIYYLGLYTPPTDKADLTDDGEAFRGFSPTTVYAGTTSFKVWCDVRNFGTKASGGFYVYYYASTNNIISTSDYYIGYDYMSSINPFAYDDSEWGYATFPYNIPEGTYYVGWIIDRTNLVSEFDEGNNIAYKTGYKLTVKKHKVTFYTDPTTCGSITFAGVTKTNGQTGYYTGGVTYSVTANPCTHYTFSKWVTTGGVTVASPTSAVTTATVSADGTLKAVFAKVLYKIGFYTDPTTCGSITFAGVTKTNGQTGNYAAGTYSTKANPCTGYQFSKWVTTGGVTVASPTSQSTTAKVTGTGTLKAVFIKTVTRSFEIWTGRPPKNSYHIGERMDVYVHVKNTGPAFRARALIYLRLSDGHTLYGPLLDMTTTIPSGFDSGDRLWNSFVIPWAPLGEYAWIAELRDPITGALITQDIWEWKLLA